MNNGGAGVLAERQNALGSRFGVAQELQGDVLVVLAGLRVVQDGCHLEVVLAAQHEFYIVEGLLGEQGECLRRYLHNFLAFKFGSRYTLFRQKAILGCVFTQLEHGCVLKFRFCSHNDLICILISKDFFCRQTADGADLLE